MRGSKRDHGNGCNDTQREHRPECGSPAPDIADRRAGGNAEDVGHGEPGQDQGHGHSALFLAHQPDRHDHGDAEIGAMRHRDGDARDQHGCEIGGDRAGGLPGGEGDGEADQQDLARKPGRRERQQRAADRDADGIAGDEVAGRRDRHVQPVGHLRQHAGNDELGRAERKSGNEQGDEGKGHEGGRRLDRLTTTGERRGQSTNSRRHFRFSARGAGAQAACSALLRLRMAG